MKNLFTLSLLLFAILASVFSQPPQAFKYQAVVRDASGNIIANQLVGIQISIHDATTGGTIVYQETFTETTNDFGLVNLEIGTGTPTIGTFSGINWGSDSKFIETGIDQYGGSSYVSMGTSELLSVPYSLYSDRSSLVSNEGTGNIFVGDSVAKMNTTGDRNSFVGCRSGYHNTTGYVNTFLGYQSGYTNSTGAGNTFAGYISGMNNSTGSLNTIIGDRSGVENTEGSRNTYLGYKSGHENTLGAGNVCLGYKAGYYNTGSNKLYIHNDASTSPLIYGEFDNNKLTINGRLNIGSTTQTNDLVVKSSGYTSGMYVVASDDERIFRIRQMSGGGGGIYAFNGSDDATILLNGEGSCWFMSGNVGIGTNTPNADLHVDDRIRIGEDPSYGNVYGELIHEGGGTGFKINANAGGGWADMHLQTDGTTRVFIESGGNVGIGTTSPASRLDVQGNVTIRDISTGAIAIELGKGLDYAEGFNVSDKTNIEPGTILCIDTENPGKLKISENPYDKTVAGIVAGANGLGSGVRLGTQEFDCDVALAGRVYCNTIASSENIEPGDMLTTSSIPGYAMKAADHVKAQGAIIGKAMESLKKGEKGQILVLVTLQ